MSEQEQLDDLIRLKFSDERDFPFDEENWAKAEEMIIATRKKEKRRRWGIIFFTGIIVGALVMIPFVINKGDNATLTLKEEKKQIAENSNAASTNSKSKEINTTENKIEQSATENKPLNTQTTTNEKEKNTSSVAPESANEEKIKNAAEIKNISATVSKEKDKAVIIHPVNTNSAPIVLKKGPAKSKNKKDELSAKTGSVAANEEKSNSVIVPPVKTEKESVTTKKETKPVRSGNGKDNASTKLVSNDGGKEKNTSVSPIAIKEEKKNAVLETKTTPVKETKDNATTTVQPIVSNNNAVPAKDTTKQTNTTVADTTKNVQPVVTKKDTLPPAATALPVQKDSAGKPHSDWTVSLDAGVNTFLSGGSGISPVGGINITKAFTPKWEIGAGIYYTYMPTYSGASTFTTSTVYDFGYTFKLTEIVTDKLHYVTAPLFLKYNLNEKNSVVLGANFFYLFNSSNIVTTYDLSYTGIQNKVSKKTSGYYNGFSAYDVGIMAGYRKDLFENFGLGIYLNYGLINIQKAGSATGINIHNNISGQLMLTYKLFK